jgi:hypothetical protein
MLRSINCLTLNSLAVSFLSSLSIGPCELSRMVFVGRSESELVEVRTVGKSTASIVIVNAL